MSNLERVAIADRLEVPAMGAGDDTISVRSAQSAQTSASTFKFGRWRRVVGLLALGLTIFLWTASNFLASVRYLRISSTSTLTNIDTDHIRRQHLLQALLRYLRQHFLLHPPTHSDSDQQSLSQPGRVEEMER